MPNRHHARPLRAESASPRFLPPQPLADRDRRLGPLGWLRRRGLAILVIVVVAALAVPVAISALGPAGRTLAPLAGGVAGAVSVSHPPSDAGGSPPANPGPVTLPAVDPAHPLDADGPPPHGVPQPPPIASLTGYRWPISAGRISLPFKAIPGGTRINHGKLWHDGVDMASFCGARVGAAHDGVVLAAGRHFDDAVGWVGSLTAYYDVLDTRHLWRDLPNVVIIDDGNGYRSIYAHFHDVTVRVGQYVKAGQQIGHEGMTGHASGCHVHYGLFSPWETRTFGVRADLRVHLKVPAFEIARIDPLLVLPGGSVALKTRQIAPAIAAAQAADSARHAPGAGLTSGR